MSAPPRDPSPDLDSTRTAASSASSVRSFGSYRLIQKVGEGGMGEVWLAEQTTPVRRQVALKVIKAGMDTAQVVTRFEAERQALALMDHPSIAVIYDGGSTPEGQPYFVMEYVKGEPITTYCDRHRLTTQERLELFTQVCQGVQHAHQKGIIHRDLKPSNILVTIQNDHPVPKIIDFGVAKATARHLTERTLFTEMGVLIGTPEYMSPEQAEMGGSGIDTRADIYSLGVLLYELLTGTTPFGPQRLREASWSEMQRIIREVDPPTPSTRLLEMSHTLSQIAVLRQTDAAKLSAKIRGDLDWIVMKCLEKDRTRRYETASDLGQDVARHLSGEPVLAAPPGAGYRIRKFVARNRTAVLAAAAIGFLLVAGIAGTTFGLLRAESRRAEAELARREAQDQKEAAEQVLRVFQDMLKGVKAETARGRDKTLLKEILDKTRVRVEEGEFRERPVVELTLRSSLGLAYLDLGDQATAERVLSAALRLARDTTAGDLKPLANATTNLAGATFEAGRPREAEQLFRAALDLLRRQFKGDHEEVADALNNHASLLEEMGRYKEAESMHREALAMHERLFPGDNESVALSKANLAFVLQQLGQYEEAERLHNEALSMRQRLYAGPHPRVAQSLNNLAMLLGTLGRDAESERLYRESLTMRRQLYQGDHASIASGLASLGFATNRLGHFADAEQLFREALTMRRRLFKADHPDIAVNLDNLATTLRMQGRVREAEPYAREALAMGQRLYQGDHGSVALTLANTANTLLALGETAEAEQLARDAVAMVRRLFKADHASTARCLDTLANVLRVSGRWPEAEPIAREALVMRQRLFKGDHRDVAQSLHTLAQGLAGSGRLAEAKPLAEQALAMGRRALVVGHPTLKDYQETVRDLSSR